MCCALLCSVYMRQRNEGQQRVAGTPFPLAAASTSFRSSLSLSLRLLHFVFFLFVICSHLIGEQLEPSSQHHSHHNSHISSHQPPASHTHIHYYYCTWQAGPSRLVVTADAASAEEEERNEAISSHSPFFPVCLYDVVWSLLLSLFPLGLRAARSSCGRGLLLFFSHLKFSVEVSSTIASMARRSLRTGHPW